MAKANGTFTYPMSSQKDIADAGSNYDNILSEFTNGTAFRDVTVNPILKTTHVTSETTTSSVTSVPSVIFTEIRKGPHDSSISNDSNSQIGNRILPVNTTITDYGTARDNSAPFKIKVYDSKASGDTNRKFVYSTTDSPATDTLGIDIDNYDYFIILNPSIIQDTSSTTQTSVRPHFAKITAITSFEEFGDGLEFTPKYPVPVPKGTNFEVFKGPAKTATDIVAVSYGLRGDANANTDNYDVLNVVSKPTFYFYNERLEQDDQLDYMEKYTLTRLRWLSTLTNITITDTDAHTKYQEGSSSVRFEVASSSDTDKLCEGMSIFNSSNVFLGNIKDITGNFFQLDFARIAISADTSNSQTYKIGRGIQNVVFRTEARIKGAIPNKGRQKLDAILVDNLRNTDNSDNNFNPSFWRKSFVNMRRHEQDSTTVTVNASHFDGELNGPSRYITSDPKPFRSDKVSPMTDIVVNNPRNRMSKIAKMIALNNSGILPRKITRGQKLRVLNTKFSDKTTMKELPVLASKTTSANTITFTEIPSSHDYKLSEKLPTNSILEIGDYYYVVDSFGTKSGSSQVLTTKARKTLTENTFTVTTTIHEFTNLVPKVVFWTGVLNTEDFDSETDVIYADNHRLSVSDSTIKKENTKFYNSRITFNSLSHHENLVDFIDRNMEYVKFQSPDRKFYQGSSIQRFYYYDNSYSLQEEVFTGVIESTDNMTENGLSTMTIEGRDNSSALLNKLVNRNLNHTEDMLFSSLNPVLPQVGENTASANTTVSNGIPSLSGISTGTITWPTSSGDKNSPKHSIAVMTTGEIIGEVESKATVGSNYVVTLKHAAIHTGSNKNVRFIDPYRFANYLSGVKALSSNPQITSTTDFRGVNDKGVVFQDSVSFFRADDGTLSTRKLQGTSNTVDTVGATSNSSIHKLGSFANNRTLGFDISETISIDELTTTLSSADSVFAFKTVNESGVDTEDVSVVSLASEAYDVISFESKDDGGATMEIAPRCPLVLGKVVNNEDDTRSDHSFYLLNTPINNGGFLHRLTRNISQKIYTSDHAYRYWDLQKFGDGTLIGKDAGIYKSASKINSYAISHPIDTDGTLGSSEYIADNRPLLGSNFLDDDLTMLNTASGPFVDDTGGADKTPPQKSLLTRTSTVGSRVPISSIVLKNIDDKAQVYEIYSTGDLYPYSKLRYNNLSANTLEFSQLGCLLQSEGAQSATVVNHRDYDGTTRMTDIRDGNFESVSIKSATKTTDQMKRFGIARLVEATFDWHFNPVDSDNLPTPEESEVTFLTYQMFKARTAATNLTFSITGSNVIQLQHTTGNSITLSAGDAVFRVDTGEMVGYKDGGSDITIASGSAVTINSATNTWQGMSGYLNTSDGVTNLPVYISPEYRNLTFNPPIFKGVLKDEETDNQKEGKTDLTSIFLVRPNYESTGFSFANLRGDDVTTTLSGNYSAGSTSLNVADASNFSSAGVGEVSGVRVRWSSKSGNTLTLDTNADDNFFYLNKQQVSSGTSIIEYKNNFDAPNILFPIVFKTLSSSGSNAGKDVSPYHPDYAWSGHADYNGHYYHSSRVLATNVSNQTTSTSLSDLDKFGYSDDANPFNNTIGDFRNVRRISTSGPTPDMIQTSARLGVNTSSDYTSWIGATDVSSSQVYQNTRNTIVFEEGSNYYSLSGMNSMRKDMVSSVNNRNITFLESLEDEQVSGKRETYHRDATTSGGGIYKAQMLVKPFLDTGDSNVSLNDGIGQDSKTLTINIESNTSQHNWLSYVPNLTGYYLVPETGYDNLSRVTNGAISDPSQGATDPAMLGARRELNSTGIIRIESHTQGQVSYTDSTIDHVIVGSSAFNSDRIYRLMRFAETTFRDTPNEIILNRLHYTGLDYSLTPSSFRTGKTKAVRSFDEKLAEGVLSMYVVLNTDTLGGDSVNSMTNSMLFSVNPLLAHSIIGCTSGSTFDMFITDGTNRQRKRVTYTYGLSDDQRLTEAKLTFNDTITGNGIVSFSEIVNVELDRKPDLDNVTSCHIGTTMLVGEEVETAIETIAKEAGMTTDTIQTQSIFTGNIVSSVSNNIVTCKKDVIGIEAGDVIYTHEGLPVGKVASVSGSSITFNDVDSDPDIDLWYTPLVNDELIKREKKTFVAINNFTEVSAFDAMNTLASKKEMDFNVRGKHIDFRKITVTGGLTKKKINYKNNRIFKIDTNAELFAKANKVTVVGDRISATAQIDEEGTEITFVDSTIKSSEDAKVKANELLELHSQDTRKIKLQLEKKGLEILEAGDIVELDFPAQSIPSGQYVIFEIENVLTSQITMTVGTFSKTIAERLSELGTGQRENTSTTFGKNSISVTGETLLKDKLDIRVTNVTYTISGTGAVSNVGFDAKVGFFDDGASEDAMAELDSSGTEVGFSRASVGVLLEYDSED